MLEAGISENQVVSLSGKSEKYREETLSRKQFIFCTQAVLMTPGHVFLPTFLL